jgi:hypothetical protein
VTRNQFFIALLTAPFAALSAAKVKPAESSEIVVKLTCDTSEIRAALAQCDVSLRAMCRSNGMPPDQLDNLPATPEGDDAICRAYLKWANERDQANGVSA